MDVAKVLPGTVRFEGCDISTTFFPEEHPPNVHFSVASVTQLPAEWTSQFDFVNERLLIAALLAEEWPQMISEMFRVLKPGGSVQLVELNPYWPRGAGRSACEQAEALHETGHKKRGLARDCALRIPGWLEQAGFTDIRADGKNSPMGKKWGKTGVLGSNSLGVAFENMRGAFVREGLVTEEKYDELMEKVRKEFDDCDSMNFVFQVICARKPL